MRRVLALLLVVTAIPAAAAGTVGARCWGTPATIVGTSGDDVIRGTAGRDVIAGLGGNDRLFGRGGDDLLCGGPGSDVLVGGHGDDRMSGGGGRDRLSGGPGDDVIAGGPKTDLATWNDSQQGIGVDTEAGIVVGNGSDVLRDIERIRGSRYADVISGSGRSETFAGGPGDDLIDGVGGANTIVGGEGTDWCYRATTVTCEEPPQEGRPSSGASPFPSGRAFFPAGPWNAPIPEGSPLHPRSEALIDRLVATQQAGFVLALSDWTFPVFIADESTPRYDVALTAPWSPYETLWSVPIPSQAVPDPQSDGHLAVIDAAAGYSYEFWQARHVGGAWSASWANRIPLAGDGFFPHGLSAKGSGSSLLGGVIWPHELAAGRIDHALHASIRLAKADTVVWPATESDGGSHHIDALPEGARLRLDPDLDLDALGLESWERAIAVALQEYGLIVGDNGGDATIGLYGVHTLSFDGASYPFDVSDGILSLAGIPVDRLQVLDYIEVDLDDLQIDVADSTIFG